MDSELNWIARGYGGEFACSLLVSRRVYQDTPNHKLGSLISYKALAGSGNFHRALFDSEMTAKLWLEILGDINEQISSENVPFQRIQKSSKTAKKDVKRLFYK